MLAFQGTTERRTRQGGDAGGAVSGTALRSSRSPSNPRLKPSRTPRVNHSSLSGRWRESREVGEPESERFGEQETLASSGSPLASEAPHTSPRHSHSADHVPNRETAALERPFRFWLPGLDGLQETLPPVSTGRGCRFRIKMNGSPESGTIPPLSGLENAP